MHCPQVTQGFLTTRFEVPSYLLTAQQLTLPFSPLGGDAVAPAEVRSFTFTKLGGALGVTERREK